MVFVIILVVNLSSAKVFGEVEFWMSSLKVLTMVGIILLMFILALGGGPK